MSTQVEKESVRSAYEDVRSDSTDTNWALFKFESNTIIHDASGIDFEDIKERLTDEDRAFLFIRVQTGDEMSKRTKFVLVTYIGPSVSTLKRAKMSTDKALVKEVICNFALELQIENTAELDVEHFKEEAKKVGGANYGTGK